MLSAEDEPLEVGQLVLEGVTGAMEGGSGAFLSARIVVDKASMVSYKPFDKPPSLKNIKLLQKLRKKTKLDQRKSQYKYKKLGCRRKRWISGRVKRSSSCKPDLEPLQQKLAIMTIQEKPSLTSFKSKHSAPDDVFNRIQKEGLYRNGNTKTIQDIRPGETNHVLRLSDTEHIWATDVNGRFVNLQFIGRLLRY